MNNNLIKCALIGLAAGFCLSAQAASQKYDKEIAMAKCSKNNNTKQNGSCSGNSCNSNGGSCGGKCNGCSGDCGSSCNSQGDQSKASSVKNKRRSAAQKVVQGK